MRSKLLIVLRQILSNYQGEEKDRQAGQVRSLLKTLYLLTSVRVNVYVFNNDDKAFFNILAGVREWHVETESRLIFHNVKEANRALPDTRIHIACLYKNFHNLEIAMPVICDHC